MAKPSKNCCGNFSEAPTIRKQRKPTGYAGANKDVNQRKRIAMGGR